MKYHVLVHEFDANCEPSVATIHEEQTNDIYVALAYATRVNHVLCKFGRSLKAEIKQHR